MLETLSRPFSKIGTKLPKDPTRAKGQTEVEGEFEMNLVDSSSNPFEFRADWNLTLSEELE